MVIRHNSRGAILPFIIVSTIVLAIVVLAMVHLIIRLGGSREGTNANDAGNLNVARCAPLIAVTGGDPLFAGVSENGKFNLKNINRVWGDALLVNLNERSMELSGTATGTSAANAARAWAGAQDISSRLATTLNTQSKKEPYYHSVANKNRLTMLNTSTELTPISDWRSSFMNRGTESNLIFTPSQLPPLITLPSLGNPVIQKGTTKFWKGYTPIPGAGGRFINFVPFEFNKQPHCVSLTSFKTESLQQKPMPQWSNPVPNAFESKARVADGDAHTHMFDSVALCNTKERFQPEMPTGFVRFTLAQDKAKWRPYGFVSTPPEKNAPKHRGAVVEPVIVDPLMWGSWWSATLDYGHQYHEPGGQTSLYMALYGMSSVPSQPHLDPMYGPLNTLLLNRANEIKPGTTLDQVCNLLHAKTGIKTWDSFILGSDRSNNLIVVNANNASEMAMLNPYVNINAHADGSPLPTISQELQNSANRLSSLIHFIPNPPPLPPFPCIGIPKSGTTSWKHELKVTPGSGGNGALLEVTQVDETESLWYGKI